MSDLVIAQKTDLINIADAIREKAGTSDGMGLDEMASLITVIESNSKLETCTVDIDGNFTASQLIYFTFEDNNLIVKQLTEVINGECIKNIICGSFIFVNNIWFDKKSVILNNATLLYENYRTYCDSCYVFRIDASEGETATIFFDDGAPL